MAPMMLLLRIFARYKIAVRSSSSNAKDVRFEISGGVVLGFQQFPDSRAQFTYLLDHPSRANVLDTRGPITQKLKRRSWLVPTVGRFRTGSRSSGWRDRQSDHQGRKVPSLNQHFNPILNLNINWNLGSNRSWGHKGQKDRRVFGFNASAPRLFFLLQLR
jgi:hypothetical protein